MPSTPLPTVGISYSVMSPVVGEILPILFPLFSVNHKLPSEQEVTSLIPAWLEGTLYWEILPVIGEIVSAPAL